MKKILARIWLGSIVVAVLCLAISIAIDYPTQAGVFIGILIFCIITPWAIKHM